MVVLGVDPGTQILGYSILEKSKDKIRILSAGSLHLNHLQDPYQKLGRIQEKMAFLIKTFKPEALAIEAPFYGKNVQSMLKLGRAQGVAIAVAITENLSVHEFAPKQIKQSICGNGNASKEQLAGMLKVILHIKEEISSFDTTDAIAAAFCLLNGNQNLTTKAAGQKKAKSWSDFANSNPNRVKKS